MALSSASPPAGTGAASRLGDALTEEIGKLKEFIDLLQREQEFLKRGEADALLPLIDNKNLIANALAAFAQAREHELVRLGLAAGRAGMDAWLEKFGKPAHREAWQTLLGLAGQARDINLTNGKLIGLHMNHNQQAFNALMSASNRAMTYGPDGQQQTGLSGRILGTA